MFVGTSIVRAAQPSGQAIADTRRRSWLFVEFEDRAGRIKDAFVGLLLRIFSCEQHVVCVRLRLYSAEREHVNANKTFKRDVGWTTLTAHGGERDVWLTKVHDRDGVLWKESAERPRDEQAVPLRTQKVSIPLVLFVNDKYRLVLDTPMVVAERPQILIKRG